MFWLIVRSFSVIHMSKVYIRWCLYLYQHYVINWCHMYWPKWIKIIDNLAKNLSLRLYETHPYIFYIHVYTHMIIWNTKESRRSSYSFKLGCVNILYICINKHWIWSPRVTIVYFIVWVFEFFRLATRTEHFCVANDRDHKSFFFAVVCWYSVNETGDYNNKNNERTDRVYNR